MTHNQRHSNVLCSIKLAWGFNYLKFGSKLLCGCFVFACLLTYSTTTSLATLKASVSDSLQYRSSLNTIF